MVYKHDKESMTMFKYKRPLVFVGSRLDMEPLIEIAEENGYKVLGILDQFYTGQKIEGIDVIGSELDLHKLDLVEQCDFFVASYFSGTTNVNNDNENTYLLRNKRISLVKQLGCNLANLIHPDVEISKTATIGRNIIFFKGTFVESHVRIGSFSQFLYYSRIAHHSIIGENCVWLPSAGCAGNTIVGDNVVIGTDVSILKAGNEQTRIGNNVIIGPGLTIFRSVPDNSTVKVDGKIVPNIDFCHDPCQDIHTVSSLRRAKN